MKRRSFLKILGAGTLAGPAAGASLAGNTNHAALLSGIPMPHGLNLDRGGCTGEIAQTQVDSDRSDPTPEKYRGALGRRTFHEVFGIPEYLRAQWRERGRYQAANGSLDPDLQQCRSFSLCARQHIQAERNALRLEHEHVERMTGRDHRALGDQFFERVGHWARWVL